MNKIIGSVVVAILTLSSVVFAAAIHAYEFKTKEAALSYVKNVADKTFPVVVHAGIVSEKLNKDDAVVFIEKRFANGYSGVVVITNVESGEY